MDILRLLNASLRSEYYHIAKKNKNGYIPSKIYIFVLLVVALILQTNSANATRYPIWLEIILIM